MKIISGEPAPKIKRGAPIKYPFSEMKIGDHFVRQGLDKLDAMRLQRAIINSARNRGYKVRTKRTGKLLKIWRIV